jgi:hypothetical protein
VSVNNALLGAAAIFALHDVQHADNHQHVSNKCWRQNQRTARFPMTGAPLAGALLPGRDYGKDVLIPLKK